METYVIKGIEPEIVARIFLKTSFITFHRIRRTNKFISELTGNMRLFPLMHCSKVSVFRSDTGREGYRVTCVLEWSSTGAEIDITYDQRLITHMRTWNFRVNGCPMYFAKPLCSNLAPLCLPKPLKSDEKLHPSEKRKEPRREARLKTGCIRYDVFMLFVATLKPTLVFHAAKSRGDRDSPKNMTDDFFRLNDPLIRRLRNIRIEDLYLRADNLKRVNELLKAWSINRIKLDFLRLQNVCGPLLLTQRDAISELTNGLLCSRIWSYDSHEASDICKVPKEKLSNLQNVTIYQVHGRINNGLLAIAGSIGRDENLSIVFFLMDQKSHMAMELAIYLGYMSPGEDEKLKDYFEYMLNFWKI